MPVRLLLKEYFKPSVLLPYLGPAFIVSVGYMDPGNWATDLEGGARFGYQLLCVLLASNITAIILQTLSAKLGIATGKDLAQLCRQEFPPWVNLPLWFTAEIAMMATDLAEFTGSAIAIHLLFDIPLILAVFLTSADVLLILAMQKYGFRLFEILIASLVGVVSIAYVFELFLAKPNLSQIAHHLFVPHLSRESLFVAIGMLGATVMPHNLYLHSSLSQYHLKGSGAPEKKRTLRFAQIDTLIALNSALFVNAAILIMSAAVFGSRRLSVTSIDEAHQTLTPLLGSAAGLAFAIALLASGLSSSTTGTLSGQVVMEGFLQIRLRPWLRRLITRVLTILPVIIAIAVGYEPIKLLILSQVILSFQLPFATVPLILFTSRKDIMGPLVNRPVTKIAVWFLAGCIIIFNAVLLYFTFRK